MPLAEADMDSPADSPRCDKCGRALATRMRREGDRVRTYLECPSCVQVTDDPPEESSGKPAPPSQG